METSVRRLRVVLLAFLLLSVVAPLTEPAEAQLNVTGQWSTLSALSPLNPIHVALLRNGKMLIVGGGEWHEFPSSFTAAVFDPVTGTFSQQSTPWDLFCNGMSFLPDGRVLITGGNLNQLTPGAGPPWTTIFDPVTEQFYRVEDMAKGRWYPSNALLDDGGTMVFGGQDEQGSTNTTTEIYDVGGGWSPPYPAAFTPGWYPRLHLLANGKVFMSGPNPLSHTFDPASGTWSSSGSMTNYGDDRLYVSSVLLPLDVDQGYAPKVIIFGGNVNGATNSVEMIDLSVWPEVWVTKPPMSVARVTQNAVLLPNGKILTLGGSTNYNDPGTAHLGTETFDPVSNTWTPSGTMAYARLYHSTALLLPDATVWVGGSNPNREVWEPHMEIYKPPYLFTSGGALAARPTIGSAPAIVGYGQAFTVSTPDAASIGKVMLMRPGSNTHGFDSEQRLIYTQFTKGSGTLTVFSPTSQGAAPPGYYMLFILNAQGVPSVAKFIQLLPHPTNQPPAATITSPGAHVTIAAGQSVTFAGTAGDPDGSIAALAWIFPGGSPSKSTVLNPGAVSFATPGVYTASLTVLDNLGVNNPSPPTVTVTVTGTATLGAAITSPASGSTVNGTTTVGMAASNAQGSPTHFVLKLDNGATLSTQTISSGSTASYAWNTAGVPAGSHTLNLTVTDGAGRTATAAVSVTVPSGGGGGGGGGGTGGNVVWTSPVNVTVSGSTITKSGGCNSCWDAGAVSQQTIAAGDGSVQFTISSGASLSVGLSHGNAGTSASEIAFGLRFFPGYVEVRESGVYKADWTLIAGAVHKVAVEGGVVKYFQNGALKYTSAVAPAYPLLVDATLDNVGNAVQAAVITTGSGGGGGGGGGGDTTAPTASITAPASGAIVSGATVTVSATASDNVGVAGVQFKLDGANLGAEDTAAPYAVTWNTTTATGGSHTLTAVVRDAAGNTATSAPITVTVTNNGGGGGGGTGGNVVWTSPVNVTVSGNTITKSGGCNSCWDAGAVSQQTIASGNGGVEFTVPAGTGATVGLSTGTPGTNANDIAYGLRFFAGYVEVREHGIYKSDWPLVTGAVHKVAVEGGAVKYYQNGALKYTSAAPPTYPLLVDATLDNVGGTVQNAVITTAGGGGGGGGGDATPPTASVTSPASGATVSGAAVTVNATASDAVGVVGVQFKLDGVNLGAEDTTAPYGISWNTTAATNGTHTLTAVARDAAGNTTTSAPVTVMVSNGGGGGGGPQNVVWTSPVNVTVSGNTITKNAGCNGCWDAGATSQQMIASGSGSVAFTISAGTGATVGLGAGNAGTNGNDIAFGLRFYPGSPSFVEVREAGVYKWDWLHVAGAVYTIAVEAGTVKYYQNGTLKYTSAAPASYPLVLDATIDGVGNAVQSAVIGP